MLAGESGALKWMKWTIAVVSAAVGAVFGVFGGVPGMISGGGSGFLLGYLFVPFLLSLKNEYALAVVFARVLAGTGYGCAAGIISGAAVYLPGYVMESGGYLLGSPEQAMGQGAFIGAVVGAPFGLALSLVISLTAAVTVDGPKKPEGPPSAG